VQNISEYIIYKDFVSIFFFFNCFYSCQKQGYNAQKENKIEVQIGDKLQKYHSIDRLNKVYEMSVLHKEL